MRIKGDVQATKAWVRSRVRLYARRLSLPYVPTVVFSPDEWRNRGYLYSRTKLSDADRGLASAAEHVVMVNLKAQLCRHDADDTAAHEVLHLRFPSMTHDKDYQHRVDLVRAGLRMGAPGSHLPPTFPR